VECPVAAIVAEGELAHDQLHWLALNEELARRWPPITQRKPALPDAADWAARTDKLAHLVR
jgi:ferredoxin